MKQVITQNIEQVSTLQYQIIQKGGLPFEIKDSKEKLHDQYDKALKEIVAKFVVNETGFITQDQIVSTIYEAWDYFILKQYEQAMVLYTFYQVNLVNKELRNKP